MKYFIFLSFLLVCWGCDYREYPEEQEWRENFEDQMREEERK